jgi:hypothetical protein
MLLNYIAHFKVESLVLIGISTLGKHATFLGDLSLLTGIQFCGGILLVPIILGLIGLAKKDREFDANRQGLQMPL